MMKLKEACTDILKYWLKLKLQVTVRLKQAASISAASVLLSLLALLDHLGCFKKCKLLASLLNLSRWNQSPL